MSFFLSHLPASTTSELLKPNEQTDSESGIRSRRFSGVAYWRGSIDFPPHQDEHGTNTLWAELERAASAGGSFYADLHPQGIAPVAPVWIQVVADADGETYNSRRGFAVPVGANTTPFEAGSLVSFRNGPVNSPLLQYVTARATSFRAINAAGNKYAYVLETPLPSEFAPGADNPNIWVCFNRPHVRAQMQADALQWTTTPRLTTPASVDWFEDIGGSLASLHNAIYSPTGDQPPPLNTFLISEDYANYITAEDGKFIVSEN